MEIIKFNLQQSGVNTKEDILTLVRSKSTKDRFTPTSITIDSEKLNSYKKMSQNSNRIIKSQSSRRDVMNQKLYN